jgi:hypothetical protein
MKPFNFADDPKLGAIGALMQRAVERRAAQGLISPDGQTHRTAAQKAVYEAGHGVLSRAYAEAGKV